MRIEVSWRQAQRASSTRTQREAASGRSGPALGVFVAGHQTPASKPGKNHAADPVDHHVPPAGDQQQPDGDQHHARRWR